jgi:hypothetical protein
MRKAFRYALAMSLVFGLVLVIRPVLSWRNAVDPLMVVVLVAVGANGTSTPPDERVCRCNERVFTYCFAVSFS